MTYARGPGALQSANHLLEVKNLFSHTISQKFGNYFAKIYVQKLLARRSSNRGPTALQLASQTTQPSRCPNFISFLFGHILTLDLHLFMRLNPFLFFNLFFPLYPLIFILFLHLSNLHLSICLLVSVFKFVFSSF